MAEDFEIETESNSKPQESAQADTETKRTPASSHEDETSDASGASEEAHDEDGEETAETETGAEDQENKDEPKPRKKGGFEKRIERFQKQMSAKDQQIAALQAEFERFRNQGPVDSKKSEPTKVHDDADAPNPDNFETMGAYIEALTEHRITVREKQRDEARKIETAKSEVQKKMQAHQSRINEFKKIQPDYEDVLNDFVADHGDINFSEAVTESILESDVSAALIYEFAKDKSLLDRVNGLSPIAAAREIGKIESRLSRSSENKSEIKKTSNAPPPPRTLGSGSARVTKSLDDMDPEEFIRVRNAQERKK